MVMVIENVALCVCSLMCFVVLYSLFLPTKGRATDGCPENALNTEQALTFIIVIMLIIIILRLSDLSDSLRSYLSDSYQP